MTISAREGSLSFDSTTSCDEYDFDTKDYDLGLAAGGGLEIRLMDDVDARIGLLYTLGLSNVSGEDGETLTHRALALQAGLALPIG